MDRVRFRFVTTYISWRRFFRDDSEQRQVTSTGTNSSQTAAKPATRTLYGARSALATIIVCAFCAPNSSAAVLEGCLHANDPAADPTARCSGDVARLQKRNEIQQILRAYQLEHASITFVGCQHTDFETQWTLVEEDTRSYSIYYPAPPSRESLQNYLAPIAHELAHVFQLESSHGEAKLVAAFDSAQSKHVELGADFLAGVILQRFNSDAMLDEFQQNLFLVGKYSELSKIAHGTPLQRQTAFRLGYFLYRQGFQGDLQAASANFHDELFGRYHLK